MSLLLGEIHWPVINVLLLLVRNSTVEVISAVLSMWFIGVMLINGLSIVELSLSIIGVLMIFGVTVLIFI